MRSQTTSLHTRSQTPEPITRAELRQLISDLREALDIELDRLTQLRITSPVVLDGLMALEGLFSTYDDLATQWRPSDTLRAIHADLESHIETVRATTAAPSLGAQFNDRPSTGSPVPDRHRLDKPALGRYLTR